MIPPFFTKAMKIGFQCLCPKCEKGKIFRSTLSLDLKQACDNCSLDLSRNDSADGPAVFLIFILGFILVPLVLIFEYTVHPPVWVHIAIWPILTLGLTLGSLKPVKAFVIALQYLTRPTDWR